MEAEEAVRRLVEGDGDAAMQKIRKEIKKKDKVIAEQAKQIAELTAKLSSRKPK
jgi:hypothetical protein